MSAPISQEAAQELLAALKTLANLAEYRELREAFAACVRPHERAGLLQAFADARAAITKATEQPEPIPVGEAAAEPANIDELRALCAAAYQALGATGGPTPMLDNLLAAGNVQALPYEPGAGLPWYGAEPAPAKAAPLTDERVWRSDEIMECNAHIGAGMNELLRLVRAVERAHGITAPEVK